MTSQETFDQFIISNEKLAFFIAYREQNNCSLRDAIDALGVRYKYLRATQNEAFTLTDEEYWQGFYS